MKKLFLVDGVAGTVKKDLIRFINMELSPNSIIVSKYTTRKKRETDEFVDLIFISNEEFERVREECYCYPYGEEDDGYGISDYGIPKMHLQAALRNYENIFVIVRNRQRIEEIRKDYESCVKVISIFIYSDRLSTKERLIAEGHSENDIDARMKRLNQVWMDYVRKPDMFDSMVLVNDASEEHLQKHLEQLILKVSQQPKNKLFVSPNESYDLIRPLVGYKERINVQLEKYPYDKNIFLMMKFRDSTEDKYSNTDLYKIIQKIVKAYGYQCIRADQEEWTNLIQNSIYNPLAVAYCCKYGIALFDYPEKGANYNPNVVYELGMMQAQGKECIVLRDKSIKEIPFDLVKEIHHVYQGENDIVKYLESWLKNLKYRP